MGAGLVIGLLTWTDSPAAATDSNLNSEAPVSGQPIPIPRPAPPDQTLAPADPGGDAVGPSAWPAAFAGSAGVLVASAAVFVLWRRDLKASVSPARTGTSSLHAGAAYVFDGVQLHDTDDWDAAGNALRARVA